MNCPIQGKCRKRCGSLGNEKRQSRIKLFEQACFPCFQNNAELNESMMCINCGKCILLPWNCSDRSKSKGVQLFLLSLAFNCSSYWKVVYTRCLVADIEASVITLQIKMLERSQRNLFFPRYQFIKLFLCCCFYIVFTIFLFFF